MNNENLSKNRMDVDSVNYPIVKWKELINSDGISDENIRKEFEKIYLNHKTDMTEIAYNSYCRKKSQQCKHCIYNSDYHKFNKILDVKEWKKGIDNLFSIGIKDFSFCGRGLNDAVFELIDYVRGKCPNSHISLIVDGPHMKKYSEKLSRALIDTLDVSLDGTVEAHDNQRNCPGSYEITINELRKFKRTNNHFSRINLLTTLTEINKDCIPEMIQDVNKRLGIKNYFVTPMAFIEGYRPNKSLHVSRKDYCKIFDSVRGIFAKLDDVYIEFSAYHARDIAIFKKHYPKIWKNLKEDKTGLVWDEEKNGNIMGVYLFPASLSCITEFPVNSDGNIFTGLVMCMGKIPSKCVFGNIKGLRGKSRKQVSEAFCKKDAFSVYLDWLKEEKEYLQDS